MNSVHKCDAMASANTKIKDITHDKANRKILHRVNNNDPNFNQLYIVYNEDDRCDVEYYPTTVEEWAYLGYLVGKNEHLESINIVGSYESDEPTKLPRKGLKLFCGGLNHNQSIQILELHNVNLIDRNIFKHLGPFFENNRSLVDLTFDNCDLGRECCRHISLILRSCASKSLTFFGIRNCDMEDESFIELIEAVSLHSKLESLDFSSNDYDRSRYVELARILRMSFVNLQHLYLGDNIICDVGSTALALALANKKLLRTFDLGGNAIGSQGTSSLSIALTNCMHLHTLDLNSNAIDNSGAQALFPTLNDKKNLETVDLSGNRITSLRGFKMVSNSLLKYLKLGNNRIDDEGIKELDLTNCNKLHTLNLSFNRIGDRGIHALLPTLNGKRDLQTVNLSGNRITSIHGFKMLSNSGLKDLLLDSNRIDDEGIDGLDLTNCRQLGRLFLGSNSIGNRGIAALMVALQYKKNLRHLDLSRNVFTSINEFKMLSNSGLKNLQLNNNRIDDTGIIALVDGLKECPTLRSLDISRNMQVTSRGWQKFSTVLSTPECKLKYLYLISNNIDDEAAAAFATALVNNNKLETLSLYNNDISAFGKGYFANLLCNNSSVEATFFSNHTIWFGIDDLADEIKDSLLLNANSNKKEVAIKKILRYRDDIDMLPFFKWENLKMLPLVIGWLERAASAVDFETNIEERKLAAILQFVLNFSWLCM